MQRVREGIERSWERQTREGRAEALLVHLFPQENRALTGTRKEFASISERFVVFDH
jgi:hypothetical protein